MDQFSALLKSRAESLGAEYFGIADLTPAREFIEAQGGEIIAGFPRAVTMGIDLPDPLVDLLPVPGNRMGALLYHHNAYDVVNRELDRIALHLSDMLQQNGYRALPIAASLRTDESGICGPISHKLAANLAGIGWIGRSCLLVTPAHGPRVRFVTVLTDATLPPTGKPMDNRCNTCMACVETCPAGAFSGRAFDKDEPREARFDTAACERYLESRRIETGVAVCGMCLWVCPHGRNQGERG
ncbi:MAG TPA: 4Fe-4S double cluster binding domain-containing protein [Methanoregulaceae archaeon]|nr:4Fe-4S double cluster binding domain-containing protein [Methanoregulaceae archaeon]